MEYRGDAHRAGPEADAVDRPARGRRRHQPDHLGLDLQLLERDPHRATGTAYAPAEESMNESPRLRDFNFPRFAGPAVVSKSSA